MPAFEELWSLGRRFDRLPALPTTLVGLAVGGAVGWLAVATRHPVALTGFVLVLVLAVVIALTAEPMADEVPPAGPVVAVRLAEPNAATTAEAEPKIWGRPPAQAAPGQEWSNPIDDSVLVYVPAGKYPMGAEDLPNARPIHSVRLSGFWIGKFPVTNAQYRRYLEASPHLQPEHWNVGRVDTDKQPVVGISWQEAMDYCQWARLGLPTEAQWEAAARGGEGRRYPWGDQRPSANRANFGGGPGTTTPVGNYPEGTGPFGTLDQAGNVWEWCLDPWDEHAYSVRGGNPDPSATADGSVRVLRGGAWYVGPWSLPSAYRYRDGSFRSRNYGFRCAVCGLA